MKTSVRFILAWALALIAFVSSASARDLFFEIGTSSSTRESTVYAWGGKHVLMIEHPIKNTSSVPVTITRLWFSHSWFIQDVFVEDGDRLIQATQFEYGDGNYAGVSVNYTLAPNETRLVRVRASLPDRIGSGIYYARVHFWSLDVTNIGDSQSYSYPGWEVPSHVLIDKLPERSSVSNRSDLARLQDKSTHAFAVTGDRFMKTRVLIRLAGPALAGFGVTDAVQDPVLRVIDSQGNLAAGADDWSIDLESRFLQVGAFPFRRGSFDSAVVAELLPGTYRIEVKTFPNTPQTGSYLIETYQLPETTSAWQVVVPVNPVVPGKA